MPNVPDAKKSTTHANQQTTDETDHTNKKKKKEQEKKDKKTQCEIKGGGHRVPPAGLPIEQVLGEYSLSFLRRDVALFVSTRARDSF